MTDMFTLRKSGERLPHLPANAYASDIYKDFSYSPSQAELLGKLSVAYREVGQRAALHSILPGQSFHLLLGSGYVALSERPCPEATLNLTTKGLVAANMVTAHVYDGDMEMWLEEPFVEKEILAELHRTRPPHIVDGRSEVSF